MCCIENDAWQRIFVQLLANWLSCPIALFTARQRSGSGDRGGLGDPCHSARCQVTLGNHGSCMLGKGVKTGGPVLWPPSCRQIFLANILIAYDNMRVVLFISSSQALKTFGTEIAIAFSGAEDVALIEYAHLTGRPYRVFRYVRKQATADTWCC